jgi:hypothetical protein
VRKRGWKLNFNELNQYKYLFLDTIQDSTENPFAIIITLKTGEVSEQTEDLIVGEATIRDVRPIIENESIRIKVNFPSYVAYNVQCETYSSGNDYDIFKGRNAREYSKSRYMEYIKSDTIASDEWPGKLKHFGISCCWEIVDIISVDEPKIQIVL